MNKIILFLAGPFIFSCHMTAQKVRPTVAGKYVIVGFKVTSDMERDGKRLIAASERADYAFNFVNNNALLMAPQLAMLFFADSVFQYQLTADTLYLTGKNGANVIPYRNDFGCLNLFIHKSGIDTLQIVPVRKDSLH